jgi:hypothetical protein
MLPLPSANPKLLLGWKLASSSEDLRKGPRDECFRNLRRCGFAPRHILIDRACLVNVSKSAARLGAIGLRKSYGSRLVLDGVSIAINAGPAGRCPPIRTSSSPCIVPRVCPRFVRLIISAAIQK